MKPARLPFFIIIILLVSFLLYLNYANVTKVTSAKNKVATKVMVEKVSRVTFKDIIEALGTATANEAVTIHPQYSGTVKAVHFNSGDSVKKGKLLVSLNSEEEEAEVRELQANLAEAKRKLARFENLRKTNAAAQSVVDEQSGEVDAISAQLEQAQAKVNKYQIKAPFDGILGTRNISVGTYLSTQVPVTTLDDVSIIKVDFTLPEKDLTKIHVGQKIEATNIAYGENIFIGEVTNIDSRLDPITRSISVRAIIDNKEKKLKPGMLLKILLLRSIEEVILIDEGALIPKEDKQWVYVVEDNIVKPVDIVIGRRRPGVVEVIKGLELGETIIVEGALKVRKGSTVNATFKEE